MPYKDKERGKQYKKQWYKDNSKKRKEQQKQYRENNREKLNEASKIYRLNNLEKVRETQRKYYQKNKEKIIEKSKQWRIDNPEKRRVQVKKWRKNNPEKAKKTKRVWTEKMYKNNIMFNLNMKMSTLMRQSLKGEKNGRSFITFVDYTVEELKEHLEKTMPEGYSWNDFLMGELHIDHIIPIRVFSFKRPEDEEFKQCWNLHNLRLLPSQKNIEKSDKIDNPILLALLIKEGDLDGRTIKERTSIVGNPGGGGSWS